MKKRMQSDQNGNQQVALWAVGKKSKSSTASGGTGKKQHKSIEFILSDDSDTDDDDSYRKVITPTSKKSKKGTLHTVVTHRLRRCFVDTDTHFSH